MPKVLPFSQKGEALHLLIESSILGESPQFQLFFLQSANQNNSLEKKKLDL
jgi:hypothetical protein